MIQCDLKIDPSVYDPEYLGDNTTTLKIGMKRGRIIKILLS